MEHKVIIDKDGDSSGVRVRFAPSPTGHLHIGGARTALYNWLFARGRGGAFVLRLEDTDLARSTGEAVRQIIGSLRWLGLDWDEGPEAGGGFGPYRQTERAAFYRQAVDRLIEEGKAFYCYCSPEELEAQRMKARAEGRPVVYQGTCRWLTEAAAEKFKDEGRSPAIRLKIPVAGKTVVRDIVRGDVEFDNTQLGDFIIVRSSGAPTYNFAAAVDDTAMKISHVIRGDDHLPNTPRQLLLLEALGEKPPRYAHLPLILGPDRSPLSKRHGDVSVDEFRARGFLPEAIRNYLALLGWSYDAATTIFSTEDLVARFSLKRVSSTAAVFDPDKLMWMNGHYIRNISEPRLAEYIEDYLEHTGLEGMPGTDGRPQVSDLVPLVQEKMKTLADFATLTDFFFLPVQFEEKALVRLKEGDKAAEILQTVAGILGSLPEFDTESLDVSLRAAASRMKIRVGKFLEPVRIAVSGKQITPGMFETLSVLGRELSIARIRAALELIKTD